eukprot:gene18508-37471_t
MVDDQQKELLSTDLMPLHFIRNTIKPFYVQAREAGIEIVYSSETELSENRIQKPSQPLQPLTSAMLSTASIKYSMSEHLEESSSTNVCMNDILRLEIIDMGAGISP